MMTVWCEPLHVSFFPSNFSVFSPQSLLPYAIIIFLLLLVQTYTSHIATACLAMLFQAVVAEMISCCYVLIDRFACL
jgi:hypothetical protein